MPRLFALLPDKKEASYHHILSTLLNLRPNCRPVTCLLDFEQALHNAFASVFPAVETVGCVFHLGLLGESKRYNTDASFQLKIKSYCALAFLPIDDIVGGLRFQMMTIAFL